VIAAFREAFISGAAVGETAFVGRDIARKQHPSIVVASQFILLGGDHDQHAAL
jgi:hypothetical protein